MRAEFPDGVAVVVGGSGGVGSAIVERLASYGANVAVTYRGNVESAERAAEEARAHGVRASVHRMVMGDGDGVRRGFEEIAAAYGRVHTVVHAAGSKIEQPFIGEIDAETWRAVIEADVNGVFDVVQATLPMLRAGGGSYVFISSAGLVRYPAGDILSVAPKAAV